MWADGRTDINDVNSLFFFSKICERAKKSPYCYHIYAWDFQAISLNFATNPPPQKKTPPLTPTLVTYPTNLVTRTTFGEENKELQQQCFDLCFQSGGNRMSTTNRRVWLL